MGKSIEIPQICQEYVCESSFDRAPKKWVPFHDPGKKNKMFLEPFWCSPLGCNRTMVLNWGRQQPGLHGHGHLHVQFTEFSSCSQAQHYTLARRQLRVQKLTSCFELTAKRKHTKKNLCVQGLCRWSHSDPWIPSLTDIDTFCLSFLLHWIGTCYTGLKQLKSKRSHTNIPPDLGTLASSGQITRSWRCSAQDRDCYTLSPISDQTGSAHASCVIIVAHQKAHCLHRLSDADVSRPLL